jgi:uncharacterized protein (DUF302 family)
MSGAGLRQAVSPHDFQTTATRLDAAIAERGVTVFARIDHAAGAAEAGLDLRPTLLFVFGNPKGGTKLMQDAQTSGIDLPLKILLWEDADGVTRLAWNDPAWIAGRHGADASAPAVRAMAGLLATLVEEAIRPPAPAPG